MAATKTRRRTAPKTPTAGEEAVRAMLREIAYVLHVTRKVNRETPWPPITRPAAVAN